MILWSIAQSFIEICVGVLDDYLDNVMDLGQVFKLIHPVVKVVSCRRGLIQSTPTFYIAHS